MSNTQKIFQDSILWVRLAICANTHIKKALLHVVHNTINHPQVTGIPSDPNDLFMFLQTKQNKIKNAKHLKKEQKSILLPISSQSVNSSLLDISLIRWLIQTFSNITNASGNWQEPLQTDQTICANVYRAANIRNKIFHYDDVETLDEKTFETLWKAMKGILNGLNYTEDIEPMRTETLDITKMQGEMLKEFQDLLEGYKNEISKETSPECYIQRHFSVDKDTNDIVSCTEIEKLIKDSDQLNIFANAGVGKSVTARNIKYQWGKEKILNDFFLLYFDSKQINQHIRHNSFSAPLFFSELGYFLRKKGKTEQNFKYFDCVRTTFNNLVIIVDGIDEFPIKNLIIGNYVDKLENRVKNNEEISASDTIIAIYFGFLFPYSKICLLGRIGEFEQLKKLKSPHHPTIFNEKNRIIKELELLKLDDINIEKFTCLKICQHQQNERTICTNACKDVYEKIRNIELCKTPTDLNSLIKLHKEYPNESIGRITRTKLLIATLLNRLNEHIYQKNCFTLKTFCEIHKQEEYLNYLECIRVLGEISLDTLLEGNVTLKVEEEKGTNDIIYLKYANQVYIKRKTLEELDLFYVRDFDYYFILEPYHLTNMEFLSACHLFSHPDEWSLILRLNMDRQLAIISFVAGLYANDYFVKDFVKNVLDVRDFNYSKSRFFNWLFNVEDVRRSLPGGGDHWYGLMDNQKLSPSFFLLDSISHEVEIPKTFIPTKTIVCYCSCYGDYDSSFEWYNMAYFKHNFLTKRSDKLNIELFIKEFPSFNFMIKCDIMIYNNDQFYLLDQYAMNNLLTFRINELIISTLPVASFNSCFKLNTLYIWKCDWRTIDMILELLSPPATNTSSSNIPTIQCKRLRIFNITDFNSQQTEQLFTLGLLDVVDNITLRFPFFTDDQIGILKNVERQYKNKMINIELYDEEFNRVSNLPNIGKRHVSLYSGINNITDNDMIKLRKHISQPGYSNNFFNYKIINFDTPFVQKKNLLREYQHSLYLNMWRFDFSSVCCEVFAKTFSLIPSLECHDDYKDFIPSSHWFSLSRIEDCRINEIRIWFPKWENLEYFFNIRTNIIQFIYSSKDNLVELLKRILNNPNIQSDKKIKAFVVKIDDYDWDYYIEITLFDGYTIEEYKNNYNSQKILSDNIHVQFHEGERHSKWWCCEISSPETYNHCVKDNKTENQDNNNFCILSKCCCCFLKS